MASPEDAVLARRRLTNRLIAAHEAGRLKPFLDPKIKLVVGDGTLILGADAVVSAFAAQFAEPGFVAYVRTPEAVEADAAGERAAERGRWTGTWRRPQGETTVSGVYAAAWRKQLGQWVIESELYVTLQPEGGAATADL